MLREFHDDPATPSGVADRLDLSLQNAQYHIGNLEDAGLIEQVDTVYSEKGREMTVYGPADAPLIVYAGTEDETTGLKAALSRLVGAVAALGLTSLLVQSYFGELPLPFGRTGGADDYQTGADGTATQAATETESGEIGIAQTTPEPTATPTPEAVRTAEDALALPPGLLFFLGGVTVLLGVAAVWWLSRR